MTITQIIFLVTAAVTLFAALNVVMRRNLVHAGLFLVLALFGVAAFFVLLEAPFLAVVQVVIYIGAISILMIFGVMLTRRVADDDTPISTRNAWLAGMTAVLALEGLVVLLGAWPDFETTVAPLTRAGVAPNQLSQVLVEELGVALVSPNAFILPFEVASVLLLAALIGAIYIASERNNNNKEASE